MAYPTLTPSDVRMEPHPMTPSTLAPWQSKAHAIIARLCLNAYRAANVTRAGTRRKRHVPYQVPDVARRLVEALARNDEETAKAIFLFDYDAR